MNCSNSVMECIHHIIETIVTVFVVCIYLILFIDHAITEIRDNKQCNITEHMTLIDRLIDRRIQQQSHKSLSQSIYVKHVELKLKMMERDRNMIQRMIQIEEKMKQWIRESEKNTFTTLEPFLNDNIHTTCYVYEPIDYIEINLSNDELRLLDFDSYMGAKGKHCFFEFFLYDFNDNLIDDFDIDFDYANYLLQQQNGYYDERIKEIANYLKEKLNLTIKDDKKFIYSNTKSNSIFFASPCIKITLSSKISFKKIIISTKDTVVGFIDDCSYSRRDAKPKKCRIELCSWNDEKTKKNIIKKFSLNLQESNYTCIIHN